jgi:hypothetical protein
MESEDPVHPIFRNTPPPEAKLWRYLSFAKFASLLHSQRLHFTRVDHFDDHFEGAWPRSDHQFWTKDAMLRVFHVPDFTEEMKRRVAASCWFESQHESAAMWRLYAPGAEGVAITTTFNKLRNLVATVALPTEPLAVGAGRVTYVDHSNEGLIENLREDERLPNLLRPFMLKNNSYEHEKEVRALVIAGAGPEIGKSGFDLRVSLNDFIEEVVVNPFCQTWFMEAVVGVANLYGLESKHHQSSLSREVFYIKRQQEGNS